MRKVYRIAIAIISFIGACVMGYQKDYLVMTILLLMAVVFFVNRNRENNKDE